MFSKLDFIRAYHHIPKTAITMPFRLLEFLCIPFGLRNMMQCSQRFIDYILHGLHFACVYVNNVLIASSSMEEHIKHVQLIFQHFGVVINPVKHEFGKSELILLGCFINSAGISPSPSKVEALANFPAPDTMRNLRQFWGMIKFLSKVPA